VYSTVLDAFRADFDDFSWDIDDCSHSTDVSNLVQGVLPKVTNTVKLRSTAKNSIVTYNAIQKVYKSRFDDSRSNANIEGFQNSENSYPFLLESKAPYESMLSKNSNSFFNVNLYNTIFFPTHSLFSEIFNSLNYLYADIPFLLSFKSDAARYLWFDWQSRWSSIEVQPSSIAKYSLAGLPYFTKVFEYSTQVAEELNDAENYLTKLSRARKNYMPNWAYSPYFFSKVTNWYNISGFKYLFNDVTVLDIKKSLRMSRSYWKGFTILPRSVQAASTPSHSAMNRPNTVTWSPLQGQASSYYTEAVLLDILSKREGLYRSFLRTKSNVVALPHSLTVSPKNSLLREIQASYLFIDPTTYGSEFTREFLYQNTNYLRYTFIKDFLRLVNQNTYNLPINFNLLSNYFVHLLGPSNEYGSIGQNSTLFKSQYRPMKKGVVNMIRLQATNAIAMPTEIRLHILASSKDVIHSWAIPSAGIKIDCVPGYSSHRVAIFLTHGIFWGQCMEICGRYHHWMPIVVYFMKRDLFFLWCTHFMHHSTVDSTFNMADKQLVDYLRLVSHDKSTWVAEINKALS
jgi:heme/copper-type cytochrome/quinol oxidase subunit 2